jgi:hypothetical protein
VKKVIIAVVIIIVILFACLVYWFGSPKGPKLEQVAHLQTPRIATMQPMKVIQVIANGDPNEIGGDAFGLLMKTYFKLKGVPKGGPDFKAPRARWPISADTPKDQWTGYYALPVPQNITEIPEVKARHGLKAELITWEYGEVAEILHVGPWSREEPTIKALKDFIEQSGYEINGLHEEEYLRSSGMLFAGDPEKYLTLIRYQVRKKMVPAEPGDSVGSED